MYAGGLGFYSGGTVRILEITALGEGGAHFSQSRETERSKPSCNMLFSRALYPPNQCTFLPIVWFLILLLEVELAWDLHPF